MQRKKFLDANFIIYQPTPLNIANSRLHGLLNDSLKNLVMLFQSQMSVSFHDQALKITSCLVCSQCDKLRIGNCSVHGSLKWVKEPADAFEKEGLTKARSTIPSDMDLKTSSIPGNTISKSHPSSNIKRKFFLVFSQNPL